MGTCPAPSLWRVLDQAIDWFALRGTQFKPLKHDMPGFNSLRINDRYRLIFRFDKGDAYGVQIDNYHGRKTS